MRLPGHLALARIVALVGVLLALTVAAPASADALAGSDVTITADLSSGLQIVDGLGVNANVHSWSGGKLRPAIDQLAAAGVSTWRVIIDRCDFEATNDDADPSHLDLEYYGDVYERGKMADLWATLAYIESKPDQQVTVSCMGGVPTWMGGTQAVSRIDPDKEDEWVEMLASLVYYARSVKGLDLKLLSPANEIDWDGNEGPQISPDQYTRLLHKLALRLDGLGLSDVRFVGPDTADAAKGASDYYPALVADPVVRARLARIGVHAYDGNARGIGDAIKRSGSGIPFWMTEFSAWCGGCDGGAPNPGDWDFAGQTAEQVFELLDQGASGLQIYDGWDGFYEHHGATGYWGVLGNDELSGAYTPRKTFYMLEQFTRFVPRGARRMVSTTSAPGVRVETFQDPATGRVTVVIFNQDGEAHNVTGTLKPAPALRVLETYTTSAYLNFAQGSDVAVSGTTFTVSVGADSLVTLTGMPDDTVAPTVTFAAPIAGATVSRAVAVSAGAVDDVGVDRVEFAVDGAPVGVDETAPFGFAWDTSGVADGPHTLTAVAYDHAGNASVPATVTVRVRNAPVAAPTIQSGPAAAGSARTVAFSFSSAETGVTFECRLDGPGGAGGSYSACSSPTSYPNLADGAYSFSVRARDEAGNTDPTPATRPFVIDTSAPAAPVVSAPLDGGTQRTSTVAFAGTGEPGAQVVVSEDGTARGQAPLDGSEWSVDVSGVADGEHTYRVVLLDAAGNESPAVTVRVSVDTAAPETTVLSGPAGLTTDRSPSFAFSSGDAGATFECRLGGESPGVWGTCTSPRAYSLLADGTYMFAVRATDAAGNVDTSPATRTFTLDAAAPATPGVIAPVDGRTQGSASIAFSGTAEVGATIVVSEGGAVRATTTVTVGGTWSATVTNAGDGAHDYTVKARDAAGNESASRGLRVTVDTRAPETSFVSGPEGTVGSSTARFEFSADEAGVSFECRLDDSTVGVWEACASPRTYTALADGSYTLRVRATDGTGNTDATPAARTFTIDVAAPETSLSGGPAGPTNNPSPTFTFSASRSGSTFECRLDGATVGTWQACASPVTFGPLTDTAYQLNVRAVGAGSTRDESPATRAFTVDTVAPDTAIDSGPDGMLDAGSGAFTFSASEPGARFECQLEAPSGVTGYTACASGVAYTFTAPGDHSFAVKALDAAGNADPTPARRAFTVAAEARAGASPTPTATPAALPSPGAKLQEPAYRKTVVLSPLDGRVRVRLAGAKAFVALAAERAVALGSEVDVKAGTVRLVAAPATGTTRSSATFTGGTFRIAQAAGGLVDLTLTEPLASCRAKAKRKAGQVAARRLWGEGAGSFRIRGTKATATSQNGRWLVEDSCSGTLVRVTTGSADVKSGSQTTRLRAGRRLLVRR